MYDVVTTYSMESDEFSVCDNIFLIKDKFGRNWYIMKYYTVLFPDDF